MIKDFKKETKRQEQEFQNGVKKFIDLLSDNIPNYLVLTPLEQALCPKEGLLYIFNMEQKNPTKGSRNITIAINREGKTRIQSFGEIKNGHEGIEYEKVGDYDLQKAKFSEIYFMENWSRPGDFVINSAELVKWISAGN